MTWDSSRENGAWRTTHGGYWNDGLIDDSNVIGLPGVAQVLHALAKAQAGMCANGRDDARWPRLGRSVGVGEDVVVIAWSVACRVGGARRHKARCAPPVDGVARGGAYAKA